MYVVLPRKSLSLIVPALINVMTTSAGMLTSALPLSIVKFKLIAPLIKTGTTNVPPSICMATPVDPGGGPSREAGGAALGIEAGCSPDCAFASASLQPALVGLQALCLGVLTGLHVAAELLHVSPTGPPDRGHLDDRDLAVG